MWVKYVDILLQGQKKETDNLKKDIRFENRDLNMGLPEHEGSILTTFYIYLETRYQIQ
jgi:hypothetical protein